MTKRTNLEMSELDNVIGAGIPLGTVPWIRGGLLTPSNDLAWFGLYGGRTVSKPIEMPGGHGHYVDQTAPAVFP